MDGTERRFVKLPSLSADVQWTLSNETRKKKPPSVILESAGGEQKCAWRAEIYMRGTEAFIFYSTSSFASESLLVGGRHKSIHVWWTKMSSNLAAGSKCVWAPVMIAFNSNISTTSVVCQTKGA